MVETDVLLEAAVFDAGPEDGAETAADVNDSGGVCGVGHTGLLI